MIAVFGWVIWAITCVILVSFILATLSTRNSGPHNNHLRYCLLLVLGLIITILMPISKLHLLWWVPVTFFVNLLLSEVLTIIMLTLFHLRIGRWLVRWWLHGKVLRTEDANNYWEHERQKGEESKEELRMKTWLILGHCPLCGSKMEILSRSPYVALCSNSSCSNSKNIFD